MNKQEQSDLCRLLAKVRYDIMTIMLESNNEEFRKEQRELIEAINKILTYTNI